MIQILRLSFRNVFRNKRRSAISALGILVGVGAIVFLDGFSNAFMKNLIEDQVLAKAGAVQVHKKGFAEAEKDPLAFDLPADAAFGARLLAVPGATAASPRITFEGMLSNGTMSSMFVGLAIDPVNEYKVCPLRRTNVKEGSQPIEATGPDAADAALVGTQLADSLDAKAGSTLTMLSAARGGASNALDVTVRGFLPSRFIIESKRAATVPLSFAQELLKLKGRATEWAVGMDDLDQADALAARMQAALGPDYVVESWTTTARVAAEARARIGYVFGVVIVILFFLVATGIINTMLMSVFERVREIGTMLAVGTRRRQVMAQFLGEAAILGLGGAIVGAIIGALIVLRFGVTGFAMKPPGGELIKFYPFVGERFVALTVMFAVLGTVLAGLFPAWKASRLSPAEALRTL